MDNEGAGSLCFEVTPVESIPLDSLKIRPKQTPVSANPKQRNKGLSSLADKSLCTVQSELLTLVHQYHQRYFWAQLKVSLKLLYFALISTPIFLPVFDLYIEHSQTPSSIWAHATETQYYLWVSFIGVTWSRSQDCRVFSSTSPIKLHNHK
jgi:hypothetical protein